MPYFAAMSIAIVTVLRRDIAAIVIAAAIAGCQWLAPASGETGAARFLESTWDPPAPPGSTPF